MEDLNKCSDEALDEIIRRAKAEKAKRSAVQTPEVEKAIKGIGYLYDSSNALKTAAVRGSLTEMDIKSFKNDLAAFCKNTLKDLDPTYQVIDSAINAMDKFNDMLMNLGNMSN